MGAVEGKMAARFFKNKRIQMYSITKTNFFSINLYLFQTFNSINN